MKREEEVIVGYIDSLRRPRSWIINWVGSLSGTGRPLISVLTLGYGLGTTCEMPIDLTQPKPRGEFYRKKILLGTYK